MHINRCCDLGRQKCDLKGSREDFKIQGPDNRNTTHVEGKNKGDTSNNRSDWDHFKIIQKIHKEHTRRPCSEGTTENSHIGHCTHTSESANVKVQ